MENNTDQPFALEKLLFPGKEQAGFHTYMIFDSTKNTKIHDQLLFEEPPYIALYNLQQNPNFEPVTPYLIQLQKDAKFSQWLWDKCIGKEIGFFFLSPCDDLNELYKHFAAFIQIQKPDSHSKFYFNFYNPISLNLWLEAMPKEARLLFFNPIDTIIVENEMADGFNAYTLSSNGILYKNCYNHQVEPIEPVSQPVSPHTAMKVAANINNPWVFSTSENEAMSAISRKNFLLRIFKKIWQYDSIREKHKADELWEKLHNWSENLLGYGIKGKQDMALFLACFSQYEEQWYANRDQILSVLANLDQDAHLRYEQIKMIVLPAEEGTSHGA